MPPWMHSDKQPCGTYEAYRRHLYHDEPPCIPCKEARRRRYHEKESPRTKDRRPAARPSGWQPGMVADVMALLDICEAVEGPGPEWYREMREERSA